MNFRELPQNLLGKLIIKITKAECNLYDKNNTCFCYYLASRNFNKCWGVCLGEYIIVSYFNCNTLLHEWGHKQQSKKYGWLYLLIVGIPSITRNIWDKIAHRKWAYERRYKWYYSAWPEKQADELGGVKR